MAHPDQVPGARPSDPRGADVIDNARARRIFLAAHGLSAPPGGRPDPAGLEALIAGLGFVQVDSIATVERAHHMILRARAQGYRPADLDRLLARGRLFEHWTHDASIIPTTFYPLWKPRFRREAAQIARNWARWQGRDYEALLEHVRARIAAEGPLEARDLGGESRGSWWGWAPQKTALEYLWRTGELAIAGRQGFRKLYDLAERVLPEAHAAPEPDPADWVDRLCSMALDRLGFASAAELAAFWGGVTRDEAAGWIRARGDRLVPVRVEGADGAPRPAVTRPATLDTAPPEPPGRVRVLSPFDPALRDRARALRLFGFDYRIEIYVPAERRKYGYYVFPLLEGDRLIGRVDMKADRARGRLAVARFWPEAGQRLGRGRVARIEAELGRVARFAGCETVDLPADWPRLP